MIEKILILHGGELSSDVAAQIESKVVSPKLSVQKIRMSKSKEFKAALIGDDGASSSSSSSSSSSHWPSPSVLAIFVVQTIENESPPEEAGACVRFFQRKTHPATLLVSNDGGLQFAVLGLGDSNLLLDRQHTAAKDCNQVAQSLDARLEALGGTRFCERGEADERTGLTEVEPWIEQLLSKIIKQDECQ